MAEDDENEEFHEGNPWNEGPDPEALLPSEEGTNTGPKPLVSKGIQCL